MSNEIPYPGYPGYYTAVLASGNDHVPSFQVRITERGSGLFMVGYVKADEFQSTGGNWNHGWFISGKHGSLLGVYEERSSPETLLKMGTCALQCGDLVKVAFDKDLGQIKFQVNGQDYRVWAENVRHHGPILPCIDFHGKPASVSIVD
eukprot:TRINITY_DN17750_c0_g3_i1.p1 TRINITY_DN17750_c0_g3~~TRINITY_DN17750_c0_g3_i1.p1  ORF type:complete len:159 (+),score=19.94 TRINITY_DN17750_c0_g3_i1:36-479(+)